MEIIYKCIDVAVNINDIAHNIKSVEHAEEEKTLHSSSSNFYTPTSSVPVKMTITFDNRSGERTAYAYTLLALLGVHSFRDLWKLLFDNLIVTPYLSHTTGQTEKSHPENMNSSSNNTVESSNNTTSMHKQILQSSFCYGMPVWLSAYRHKSNKQEYLEQQSDLEQSATSISNNTLASKKYDKEILESNRLVEEIHAMLEGNDTSVVDKERNESPCNDCQTVTPEFSSVVSLSSPFAITVHSMQEHHAEHEHLSTHNASTSEEEIMQEGKNSKNSRNNNKDGNKGDCSCTIPTFVQYTYEFNIILPEQQCKQLIANMENAPFANNNSSNDISMSWSQSPQKVFLLLLMLETPLTLNCNTHTNGSSNNFNSSILHVEAIRRVLSSSVSSKHICLPLGCSSIPLSIHRPLLVNHIACSRLRNNAFLLSCTVENSLLPSSSSSSSSSSLPSFALELCSSEIDLRTTQRVPCSAMHHNARKRELLKRFTMYSNNNNNNNINVNNYGVGNKTKKKKHENKINNYNKSSWSKIVHQYNNYDNISVQESTINNSKYADNNKTKISTEKQREQEEEEWISNVKENFISFTSRWGTEYKNETTLSICNDCINVIPLSAETAPLPLLLHTSETYSFQFMLEFRPEVTYWLMQYAEELLHSQTTEATEKDKAASKATKTVTQSPQTTSTAGVRVIKSAAKEQENTVLTASHQRLQEKDYTYMKRVNESSANLPLHRSTSVPFAPSISHSIVDATSSHSAPLHILDKSYNAIDVIDALSQIYTTNLFLSYKLRLVDKSNIQNNKEEIDYLHTQSYSLYLTQPITWSFVL